MVLPMGFRSCKKSESSSVNSPPPWLAGLVGRAQPKPSPTSPQTVPIIYRPAICLVGCFHETRPSIPVICPSVDSLYREVGGCKELWHNRLNHANSLAATALLAALCSGGQPGPEPVPVWLSPGRWAGRVVGRGAAFGPSVRPFVGQPVWLSGVCFYAATCFHIIVCRCLPLFSCPHFPSFSLIHLPFLLLPAPFLLLFPSTVLVPIFILLSGLASRPITPSHPAPCCPSMATHALSSV